MSNSQHITDDELLDDLQRVARELGHSPSFREYDNKGEYNARTIQARFGRFNEAKAESGLEVTPPPREHGIVDPEIVNSEESLEEVLDS